MTNERPDLNKPGVMKAVRNCGGKQAWDASAIDRPVLVVDFEAGASALTVPRLEPRLGELLGFEVEVVSASVADTDMWRGASDLDPADSGTPMGMNENDDRPTHQRC